MASKTRSRRIVLLIVILLFGGASIGLFATAHYYFHKQANDFKRKLVVGMPIDKVEAAVGQPEQRLEKGMVLEHWGDGRRRILTKRASVYYVVPKSIHRILLLWDDNGRLAGIEHHLN
ncbi:MAG: hypothetical protein CMJ78_01760 [Planctomycetaceae bacterium]|nr:hypothetical protein [Planctomycetaceae bacterium]